jgi:AcrR family transcriptional regulator
MEAVRRFGPDASIDQMAEAAGVSKPVLYSEFGGKFGLVDAMAVQLAAGVERTVIARLAADRAFSSAGAIEAVVDALIDLVDSEPQIYAYIVRNLRTSDRGLLDNALVRVIHDRAALILGHVAAELRPEELRLLTDGVFGFVFAVIESWMATRELDKDRLVATITTVIQASLKEVAARQRPPSAGA